MGGRGGCIWEARCGSSPLPGGVGHCSGHLVCASWAFTKWLTNHPGLPQVEGRPGVQDFGQH